MRKGKEGNLITLGKKERTEEKKSRRYEKYLVEGKRRKICRLKGRLIYSAILSAPVSPLLFLVLCVHYLINMQFSRRFTNKRLPNTREHIEKSLWVIFKANPLLPSCVFARKAVNFKSKLGLAYFEGVLVCVWVSLNCDSLSSFVSLLFSLFFIPFFFLLCLFTSYIFSAFYFFISVCFLFLHPIFLFFSFPLVSFYEQTGLEFLLVCSGGLWESNLKGALLFVPLAREDKKRRLDK